jgi:predicted transcriptional regulator
MRDRISWLTQADERILEFLNEKEIEASPSVIAANIDYNPSYIARRCKKLLDAELLVHTTASNYRINSTGKDYLAGELKEKQVDQIEDLHNSNGEGSEASV